MDTRVADKVADQAVIDIAIEGMTCASCVARVEKAIRAVPGVRDASVNLATEKAAIRGEGLDVAAIMAAVEQAGYAARPADANRQETPQSPGLPSWWPVTPPPLLIITQNATILQHP